jgi:hypothetical protein
MCACVCMCVCACVCVCMRVCACACACHCVRARACVCVGGGGGGGGAGGARTHAHAHIQAHTDTHVCACTHNHTHKLTNTHSQRERAIVEREGQVRRQWRPRSALRTVPAIPCACAQAHCVAPMRLNVLCLFIRNAKRSAQRHALRQSCMRCARRQDSVVCAAFALGGAGSSACPPNFFRLDTADACSNAAVVARATYGGIVTLPGLPVGCHWVTLGGTFYFNADRTGVANVYAQPVCAGAARACASAYRHTARM